MGADCKSVGVSLPRFESWTCHPGQRLFLVGPRDAQMLAGTQLVRTGSRVELCDSGSSLTFRFRLLLYSSGTRFR